MIKGNKSGQLLWVVIIAAICVFLACGAFFDVKNNKASVVDIKSLRAVSDSTVKESVKLIAVGDIMLSRAVNAKMVRHGDDYPFLKMKDYLGDGDIVFGNLESPIASGGPITNEGMVFRARPGVEKSIKNAGFNVLSVANNHMGNQGQDGVESTIKALQSLNIKTVGAGKGEEASKPAIMEKNGLKFAFLAYTDGSIIPSSYEAKGNSYGVVYMDENRLKNDIESAKKEADFVIISMHAGIEYRYHPSASQINFAHKAVDNGADMVIGHHPHQIQDVEKYKGKYIFYSLGNFVFDQEWSRETKQGLFAEIYFNKDGVFDYNLTPILISDYAQPDIADEAMSVDVLKNIKRP
ncbi:MAG: CapA family protein [Candidatus Paceibacterota bacterium]